MHPETLQRWFPFLRWFPPGRGTLKADAVAGITVALLLIPQSLAYAQLAGLPPHYGLYAAFLPVLVAALFGWCHQLHTGPVAMTSLLTAAVLVPLAREGSPAFVDLAILLCLMTGVVRLLLGLFRMSFFVNFLSHSVIVGFTNAAALIIAFSQLGILLGIPVGRSDVFFHDIWTVGLNAGTADIAALFFGVVALTLILCLKKWLPRWPGVLMAVAAATAMSYAAGFSEGGPDRVVGPIPSGLPGFRVPPLELDMVIRLIPSAFLIALIGFAEVAAVTRAISLKTGQRLNFNQELIGQGLAGIAGGFSQSYPVSGSFSRTALNYSAGARTGLSSAVAAAAVLLILLFFTPLLYHLPRSVLAAAIIASVSTLVDVGAMKRCWQTSRHDGIISVVTFAACLLLAPDLVRGIFFGAGLAIILHIYRDMAPRVAILARHEDGTLRDAERHGLKPDDRVIAIRFERSLTFINASCFDEAVLEAVRAYPGARHLLVVGDGINEVDASGVEAIRGLCRLLEEQGVSLFFSGLKWPVMDVMRRSGLVALIGEDHFSRTSDAALEALLTKAGPESVPVGEPPRGPFRKDDIRGYAP